MEEEEEGRALSRSEFWMRAAGVAFGLWAIFIPIGVSMVREVVTDAAAQQAEFIKQFNQYVLTMERRVTLIEERQQQVISSLNKHHSRLDELERKGNGK